MYDAALFYAQQVDSKPDIINRLKLKANSYFLSTIHRAYYTDNEERLSNIVRFLSKISEIHPIVLPLHPRTKNALIKFNLYKKLKETITLIDPIGFFDILNLEMHCKAIITDSGGVQKEAFFHQKPCITLRDETEWPELIECGCNLLLPPEKLENKSSEALDFIQKDMSQSFTSKLYGDGDAADKIAAVLAA